MIKMLCKRCKTKMKVHGVSGLIKDKTRYRCPKCGEQYTKEVSRVSISRSRGRLI